MKEIIFLGNKDIWFIIEWLYYNNNKPDDSEAWVMFLYCLQFQTIQNNLIHMNS